MSLSTRRVAVSIDTNLTTTHAWQVENFVYVITQKQHKAYSLVHKFTKLRIKGKN